MSTTTSTYQSGYKIHHASHDDKNLSLTAMEILQSLEDLEEETQIKSKNTRKTVTKKDTESMNVDIDDIINRNSSKGSSNKSHFCRVNRTLTTRSKRERSSAKKHQSLTRNSNDDDDDGDDSSNNNCHLSHSKGRCKTFVDQSSLQQEQQNHGLHDHQLNLQKEIIQQDKDDDDDDNDDDQDLMIIDTTKFPPSPLSPNNFNSTQKRSSHTPTSNLTSPTKSLHATSFITSPSTTSTISSAASPIMMCKSSSRSCSNRSLSPSSLSSYQNCDSNSSTPIRKSRKTHALIIDNYSYDDDNHSRKSSSNKNKNNNNELYDFKMNDHLSSISLPFNRCNNIYNDGENSHDNYENCSDDEIKVEDYNHCTIEVEVKSECIISKGKKNQCTSTALVSNGNNNEHVTEVQLSLPRVSSNKTFSLSNSNDKDLLAIVGGTDDGVTGLDAKNQSLHFISFDAENTASSSKHDDDESALEQCNITPNVESSTSASRSDSLVDIIRDDAGNESGNWGCYSSNVSRAHSSCLSAVDSDMFSTASSTFHDSNMVSNEIASAGCGESPTSSHSDESFCSDSSSDNISVSSSRLSLGSVGRKIFGKTLFGEEEVDDHENDDCSNSGLCYSIQSDGINTTTLESQSQDDFLEVLYGLEEKNGCYGSDISVGSESSGSSSQSDDDLSHGSSDYDLQGEIQASDYDLQGEIQDDNIVTYADTDGKHIISPPRVKRHYQRTLSSSSHDDELETINEGTLDCGDSAQKSGQKKVELKSEMASKGMHMKDMKLAPKTPCLLDIEGLCGIVRGDSMLCILDSPGKRSRRMRSRRPKIIGKKRTMFGSPSTKSKEKFSFCKHSVLHSVDTMRKLRADNTTYGENILLDYFSELPEKKKLLSSCHVCPEEIFQDRTAPISSQLEGAIVDNLEDGKFEAALSHLEQILSIFADELASKQRFGLDVKETNANVGITLHNMGIVHLLNQKYDDAVQVFERALKVQKADQKKNMTDHDATLALTGLACYAIEDFISAKKHLKKALISLQNKHEHDNFLTAEILNNLGCIHYETGNQTKAIKHFEESLTLLRKIVVTEICKNKKPVYKQTLMKIAVTQANIGYVHFELNNADDALAAFLFCSKLSYLILHDDHPFSYAIMDYTALAHLRKENKTEAIKMYSKMLTSQINKYEGGDNIFCSQTLIKLNMLQAKRNDKSSIRSCMKKVKEFVRDNNDQCQHERLEKLLKFKGVVFF